MKDNELKEVNTDIIFFFLSTVASLISFYIILEKKKSILKLPSIDNNTANVLYKNNRRLRFIIAIYFFLNAYYSYKNSDKKDKGEELLLIATFFSLISTSLYLPLGNSNLIIDN